ncbi:MAG: hypothetical protein AB1921_13245 [Thermodesulfobacteriota bacterium]
MKYRYVVSREDQSGKFVISEFSRRSEDALDLTGSAEFPREALEAAAADGPEGILAMIRTDKMYPPAPVANDLAARILEMLGKKAGEETEAAVEEIDVAIVERKPVEVESEDEEEVEASDEEFDDEDLLEEDDMGDSIGRIRVQDEEEAEDITDTDI